MKLKYVTLVGMICIGISGCSTENAAPTKPEPKHSQSSSKGQKETNKEPSGKENKPAEKIGTTSSEKTTNLPKGVEKRTYNSKAEADASINGYEIIKETNIDLGHNIKAFTEGGMGHQYISWNEGRWLIRVDYPNDLQYAAQKGMDGKTFAESVVSYLEKNYLPAPKDKGMIKIGCFKNSPYTNIEWQDGNNVYEIKSNENNPLETIQKAVKAGQALNQK